MQAPCPFHMALLPSARLPGTALERPGPLRTLVESCLLAFIGLGGKSRLVDLQIESFVALQSGVNRDFESLIPPSGLEKPPLDAAPQISAEASYQEHTPEVCQMWSLPEYGQIVRRRPDGGVAAAAPAAASRCDDRPCHTRLLRWLHQNITHG